MHSKFKYVAGIGFLAAIAVVIYLNRTDETADVSEQRDTELVHNDAAPSPDDAEPIAAPESDGSSDADFEEPVPSYDEPSGTYGMNHEAPPVDEEPEAVEDEPEIPDILADADRSPVIPSTLTGQLSTPPAATRPASGLPARAPATQPSLASGRDKPAAPTIKTHTVQSGDNFSRLAVKYYGSSRYTDFIMQANPDVDPRRMRVGQKIAIPPLPDQAKPESTAVAAAEPSPAAITPNARAASLMAPPEPAPTLTEKRTYKVRSGEGWEELAQRFLGNSNRWPELFEYNKEWVPGNFNVLPEGTVIKLPQSALADGRTN